jgi:hypothetical protein
MVREGGHEPGYDATMAMLPLLSRVALGAARTADHAAESARRQLRGVLNQARLAVMVLEMRLDEEGHRWAKDMRAAAADGTLRARIDQQRPARQIVDEWLATQPGTSSSTTH